MHYYTFHPKDYISKTHFLEPMEDLAYRRMLDYIYLNECHLPVDIEDIAKKINMRTHTDSIASVLREFFDLTDDGYMNDRAEQEIAKYQEKSDKAKKSANARWSKKGAKANKDKDSSEGNANALRTDCEGNANHKPLTNNQEPSNNSLSNAQGDYSVIDSIQDWQQPELDEVNAIIMLGAPPMPALNPQQYENFVREYKNYYAEKEIEGSYIKTEPGQSKRRTNTQTQERSSEKEKGQISADI